nr:creatininase family protein [Oscillochloris trichoides]
MSEAPIWGRYVELRPDKLAAIRSHAPVAYVPWGGMEWHGPHLPLGIDGIVADAVALRAVRRTGGVLLPTVWLAANVLPHPDSMSLSSGLLSQLLDTMLAQLAAAGWRVVVLTSGHYGHAHELTMIAAAERAIQQHGLLALAAPCFALVDEAMQDRAALWESSMALALRPELVHLQSLGLAPLRPESSGVIGRDPRDTASASLGNSALNLAGERLAAAVSELLIANNTAPLQALYTERRARCHSFLERFGTDLDQATQAWWADLIHDTSAES